MVAKKKKEESKIEKDDLNEHEADAVANIEMKQDQLKSDVRDRLIGICKELPKNWDGLSEDEQKKFIAILEQEAGKLINQVCSIVIDFGYQTMPASVNSVTFKEDSIDMKLVAMKSADSAGIAVDMDQRKNVMIVSLSPKEFDRVQKKAKINPDQALEMEEGEEGSESGDKEAA